MKKKWIAYLLLCSPAFALAQKKDKTVQKFANTITAQDMSKHLYIIAGKEMEGRDTPSPGLEKAANYLEDFYKSLGFQPGNKDSYRQYYSVYRDSMLSTSMKVNGASLEVTKDFQPQTANYTATMRFSEAVFVGYGIVDAEKQRDDYKDVKVGGKLVIILDGVPDGYKAVRGFGSPSSVFGKMNAAASRGAVAVLVVSGNYPRKTFNTVSDWGLEGYPSAQIPFTFSISQGVAAAIMGDDATNILEKAKPGTMPSKVYQANIDLAYAKTTKSAQVSNVIAKLEGTDKKDEYVFLTSHYDHIGKKDTVISYGADDDGSGTTGVLELAQAFAEAKKAGKGPRRTIIFMNVSGEEKGLLGSEHYSEHPIYPLDKTSVDLNIDMIGRTGTEYLKDKDSTNYVYIIGDDKLSTDLVTITDQANNTYTKLKLDRKYNDPNDPNRFYFRSDHYNFARKGVPIIFYFNGVHADYHRPTDTPDKINYPMMAKRAQLVFYTAWDMANREEMLQRNIQLEKPKGF